MPDNYIVCYSLQFSCPQPLIGKEFSFPQALGNADLITEVIVAGDCVFLARSLKTTTLINPHLDKKGRENGRETQP